MRTLKITVELTVTDTCMVGSEGDATVIVSNVQERLRAPELAKYLHSIGNYEDAEVVKVSFVESYDTRQ
jgi:hypothetical protein